MNGLRTDCLLIMSGLVNDEVVVSLATGDLVTASRRLANECREGRQPVDPAGQHVLGLLLQEESLVARQAAMGRKISAALFQTFADEIAVLQNWLDEFAMPEWLVGSDSALPEGWPQELAVWRDMPSDEVARQLIQFYRCCGTGRLALHRVWRWSGELQPVADFDTIRLSDLVGYQSQKDEVMTNTRLFLQEGRGNNLLLYGARGTGKSSLIKAVANELAAEGLCLVELPLDRIADLPRLQAILRRQPRHYIIYIDDLSFEKADQSYKITKAVLEGSVAGRGGNVLIYATSNRRHLIVENWQDREQMQHAGGEVRAGDSMSEKLSLADRFGQTVLFTTPNQQEYLEIVQALAAADGIVLPAEELTRRALQWALWQNGHSGRTARQFVNSLKGAE